MNWHARLIGMLGVLLVVATALAGTQNAEKKNKQDAKAPPVTPNYYPLQVGNQWNYRVTVAEASAAATSRITEVETIGGLPLARLDASVNDKIVATATGTFVIRKM